MSKYVKMDDAAADEILKAKKKKPKPVAKKKRKAEIQEAPIKKKPKKPKEPSAVEQMWEVAAETLQRLAPDAVTVFADRIHTVDTATGEHYFTPLGRAARVDKESHQAAQHFKEQAADILYTLQRHGFLVQKYEYEEVPFCPKHK